VRVKIRYQEKQRLKGGRGSHGRGWILHRNDMSVDMLDSYVGSRALWQKISIHIIAVLQASPVRIPVMWLLESWGLQTHHCETIFYTFGLELRLTFYSGKHYGLMFAGRISGDAGGGRHITRRKNDGVARSPLPIAWERWWTKLGFVFVPPVMN
jgi:hypothetical protein